MTVKRKKRVLVIDDEPAMTEWLKILLEHAQYEVRTALIGARGEDLFKTWRPDAVITDMLLPDVDGLDLLHRFKELQPEAEVIVISGHGSIPKAVDAIKAGASYFLEKPIEADGILTLLDKAIERKDLQAENIQLKQKLADRFKFANIIGKSKKMQELFELIENVAACDANILIQGENGTGKELIANAHPLQQQALQGPVHQDQLRRDSQGPDRVRAVRLQEGLVHRRDDGQGGAVRDGGGRLAAARRDRRDAAVPADQAAARAAGARVPADRQRPDRPRRLPADLRHEHRSRRRRCATGSCARTCTSASTPSRCKVPPLRERTEDIPLLCEHFLEKFCQRYQKNVRGFSPAAYHVLIRNRWPGNVRELENAIERAVLVAKGSEIVPDGPAGVAPRGDDGAGGVRVPAAPDAGRDREDGDPADAPAHELEQAGGGRRSSGSTARRSTAR